MSDYTTAFTFHCVEPKGDDIHVYNYYTYDAEMAEKLKFYLPFEKTSPLRDAEFEWSNENLHMVANNDRAVFFGINYENNDYTLPENELEHLNGNIITHQPVNAFVAYPDIDRRVRETLDMLKHDHDRSADEQRFIEENIGITQLNPAKTPEETLLPADKIQEWRDFENCSLNAHYNGQLSKDVLSVIAALKEGRDYDYVRHMMLDEQGHNEDSLAAALDRLQQFTPQNDEFCRYMTDVVRLGKQINEMEEIVRNSTDNPRQMIQDAAVLKDMKAEYARLAPSDSKAVQWKDEQCR